jgi:hypothetical protein
VAPWLQFVWPPRPDGNNSNSRSVIWGSLVSRPWCGNMAQGPCSLSESLSLSLVSLGLDLSLSLTSSLNEKRTSRHHETACWNACKTIGPNKRGSETCRLVLVHRANAIEACLHRIHNAGLCNNISGPCSTPNQLTHTHTHTHTHTRRSSVNKFTPPANQTKGWNARVELLKQSPSFEPLPRQPKKCLNHVFEIKTICRSNLKQPRPHLQRPYFYVRVWVCVCV